MARVSHRLLGLAAAKTRLAAHAAAVHTSVAAALDDTAQRAAEEARARFGEGPGPSPPGAPPSDPRGRLSRAFTVTPEPPGPTDRVGRRLIVSAPEAIDLEFGTRRMAARPFLRPAAQAVARQGLALLRSALTKGLRR